MFRKIDVQEKYQRTFLQKFSLGGLNLKGDPEHANVHGESIEGVEVYKTAKRSQLYLPRNTRYKGSNFDLLGPPAAKP